MYILLHKVLISHDAGRYKPGETDRGSFSGYTNIFTKLIRLLRKRGFTDNDVEQLLDKNAAEALAITIRKNNQSINRSIRQSINKEPHHILNLKSQR